MNDVVITAAAVMNALAGDLNEFEHQLRQGRSAVSAAGERLPASAKVTAGAWLDGFTLAEWADEQDIDQSTSARLSRAAGRSARPAQTAACVALKAVREAKFTADDLDRTILIVAGNNLALAYHAGALARFDRGSIRPSHVLTCLDTDVIGAVSEVTGIHGEAWTLGAASASGTVALIAASRLIETGQSERCVVVAPLAELSPAEFRAFHDSGAMRHDRFQEHPHRLCRPFDQDRQGFVYGQGAAAVVLEREVIATERGARPLARVLGQGQYIDGRRSTEPDPAGQAAAMRAALSSAGAEAADIDYVNAHATGSTAGDVAEAAALSKVFGSHGRPLVNSTKAMIGHCLTGAGLQEIIATILQMNGEFVHPNPNLERSIAPTLALAPREAVPTRIELALSNSFAFSGINASVVLGRWPARRGDRP